MAPVRSACRGTSRPVRSWPGPPAGRAGGYGRRRGPRRSVPPTVASVAGPSRSGAGPARRAAGPGAAPCPGPGRGSGAARRHRRGRRPGRRSRWCPCAGSRARRPSGCTGCRPRLPRRAGRRAAGGRPPCCPPGAPGERKRSTESSARPAPRPCGGSGRGARHRATGSWGPPDRPGSIATAARPAENPFFISGNRPLPAVYSLSDAASRPTAGNPAKTCQEACAALTAGLCAPS